MKRIYAIITIKGSVIMKPNYIHGNACFYLIAPSFGCTTSPYKERLEKALQNFKKENITCIIGENCYKNKGVASSNTPKKRALEFMKAYSSEADVILSVGGGEVMLEILEYIDFDKIKKLPPKWFVGFSDNTNLTYTLTTICNIETIYGNNAPSFYLYPFVYDTLDTMKMLQGEKNFYGYDKWQLQKQEDIFPDYQFDKKKVITSFHYTAPFQGILLGGCLDCLVHICGTKYDNTVEYIKKQPEGIIFYLEACDLTSIGIRRALFQLKSAGWFTNIKGFLIGRSFQYHDTSFGQTPNQAYMDLLKDFNVPILFDIDLGHLPPSLPFRNGALAEIALENNNIRIKYKGL